MFWYYDYPVDFLYYVSKEFNELKKQITIVREAIKEGIEILPFFIFHHFYIVKNTNIYKEEKYIS